MADGPLKMFSDNPFRKSFLNAESGVESPALLSTKPSTPQTELKWNSKERPKGGKQESASPRLKKRKREKSEKAEQGVDGIPSEVEPSSSRSQAGRREEEKSVEQEDSPGTKDNPVATSASYATEGTGKKSRKAAVGSKGSGSTSGASKGSRGSTREGEPSTSFSANDVPREVPSASAPENSQTVLKESEDSKRTRTIFVGNVDKTVKRKALASLFSAAAGAVESVRLRSLPVGESKLTRRAAVITKKLSDSTASCVAFVVFKEVGSVERALSLNMTLFRGRHIRVDRAAPPVSLGGAESGGGAGAKGGPGSHSDFDSVRSVFVGNLPKDADEEELVSLFNSAAASALQHAPAGVLSNSSAGDSSPLLLRPFLSEPINIDGTEYNENAAATSLSPAHTMNSAVVAAPVEAVRLVRDPRTSEGKGIAFVLFKTKAAAKHVQTLPEPLKLKGRTLRITRVKKNVPAKKGQDNRAATGPGAMRRLAGASIYTKGFIAGKGLLRGSAEDSGHRRRGPAPFEGARASRADGRPGKGSTGKGWKNKTGQAGQQTKSVTKSAGEDGLMRAKGKRPAVAARKAAIRAIART